MALKSAFGRIGEKFFKRAEEPASPPVAAAIRCHTGRVREENQDRAGRFKVPIGELFIVADGVGGLSSGAKAAEMAVEGYGKFLGSVSRDTDSKIALQRATQSVNEAMGNEILTTQQSMASTVALALLRHQTAVVGHAGDSRVYLIRDGRMSRLTRDHSIVQKMVEHGIISDAQSRNHPDASVLTRSLGQRDVELEISETALMDGDALLLCSDGLWGYVDEGEIEAIATSSLAGVEETSDQLLELALKAGGADNISIIFLRVPEHPSA